MAGGSKMNDCLEGMQRALMRRSVVNRYPKLLALAIILSLAGCDATTERVTQIPEEANPEKLSAWSSVWVEAGALHLADDAEIYDLASPLFSDYAAKLRTLRLPSGSQVALDPESNQFVYPVGTVITKTFYYDRVTDSERLDFRFMTTENPKLAVAQSLDLNGRTLLETRVLVKRQGGWQALPYVWNQDQTEAVLSPTGALVRASLARAGVSEDFVYIVPNRNQCAGCHASGQAERALKPIGPHPKNLQNVAAGTQELDRFAARGWLSFEDQKAASLGAKNVNWQDSSQSLAHRARSYLDINCAHCHSATGPADTSGLYLDIATDHATRWGVCKAPIAAGQGTGGAQFSIVPGDPDASIMTYRLESTDPGAMMPELGRSLVHDEGADLIRAWISEMAGDCRQTNELKVTSMSAMRSDPAAVFAWRDNSGIASLMPGH